MENEEVTTEIAGSDKGDVNSTPIQPIYKGTIRHEFHLLGDVNDVKSVFGRFIETDDDKINWSDEFKKEYEDTLKQKVLTAIEENRKKVKEKIEAMVMEEVEKIKAVKKDIERDLETIREKTGELKQLCDFIEKVEKLFDRKA